MLIWLLGLTSEMPAARVKLLMAVEPLSEIVAAVPVVPPWASNPMSSSAAAPAASVIARRPRWMEVQSLTLAS
jgi:hypothetical protein